MPFGANTWKLSELSYYHFGDIDAGGLWKVLTANNKKRLAGQREKEYSDIIDYMLRCNCKLEQEIVASSAFTWGF